MNQIYQSSTLASDDSAVSPVIGVILMVAITVILAAVIGSMVMNLADDVGETAPNGNLELSGNTENLPLEGSSGEDSTPILTISHTGGDQIDPTVTEIRLRKPDSDEFAKVSELTDETDEYGFDYIRFRHNAGTFDLISVGDVITIEAHDSDQMGSGQSYTYSGRWAVQIIHHSSDSIIFEDSVRVS